ncbi:hypothetical protein [Kitasatospora sp. NPDC059571]|uniref:hypothetical protein n=1 Tax=Kitasatospora sp. NPDC059571 TaxID=3346871 RepID=UPI0036B05DD5
MDLARALDGLDDHPWHSVRHAYGAADDLPGLLRAFAGDDGAAADEALSELYGSILHQGTVYAASADAVPYLARIAAAGRRSADALLLLGGLAESDDEYEVAPVRVRSAVAARLPLLLPLLDSPDPPTRQAAAWAVSFTGEREAVPRELWRRWAVEDEPPVRADLLAGLARVDPAAAAAVAREVVAQDEPAPVRLAAVLACVDAGLPWNGRLHAAVLSLLPADPLMAGRAGDGSPEPLAAITDGLLQRDTDADRGAVRALLDAALRDGRAEVRAEALWAADRACHLSRSAPGRLLPALIPLLGDPLSARSAVRLIAKLGRDAAAAAPALAALARQHDHPDAGPADLADRALAALVSLAPDLAAPILARSLGRCPRALEAATGTGEDGPFPFDAALLDAVRTRLHHPDPAGNEPARLARLIEPWGAAAVPALPDLLAAFERHPDRTASAVAAIAAHAPAAERAAAADALRTAARDGALPAARALYELSGDIGPLLAALTVRLSGRPFEVTDAVRTVAGLGRAAAALVPAVREALARRPDTHPAHTMDSETTLAEVLWRTGAAPEEAVGLLDGVLARAAGRAQYHWSTVTAARAAAALGPAGRPLADRLVPALAVARQAPAAVLALLAVADPAALDPSAPAEAALLAVEARADLGGACTALEALGVGALTGEQVRRLSALTRGDRRIVTSGSEAEIIRADGRIRRRLLAVLAATDGRPAR